jgi:excisionase family DNA binding protein
VAIQVAQEQVLINVEEAARRLSVSRSFFYERILNRGLISPVRLGRNVRFRPSDIDLLVERIALGEVEV